MFYYSVLIRIILEILIRVTKISHIETMSEGNRMQRNFH